MNPNNGMNAFGPAPSASPPQGGMMEGAPTQEGGSPGDFLNQACDQFEQGAMPPQDFVQIVRAVADALG